MPETNWAGKYCRFIADNCPGHSDPDRNGCQWWWVGVEENLKTGEVRPYGNCGIVIQQRLLNESTQASRSYAAAVEGARNYIGVALRKATQEIRQDSLRLAAALPSTRLLDHANGSDPE